MEEVKSYIESGILELYVLGQLSAAEVEDVERMATRHTEVKAELAAIELAMEAYAIENAMEPSAGLGDRILAQFESDNKKNELNTGGKSTPIIIPLNQDKHTTIRTLRFALVACVALLVISVAALFSVYNDLNSAKDQIATLNSENSQFATTVSKLEFNKAGMENRIAMFDNDDWYTVKLAGVNKSPDANMLVYWNKTDKRVLVNYAAMKLPTTDKTHEFQLWALVDGKPISLGVFDEIAKQAVIDMKTIGKAQAFAVTIEPTGGSINPTMEQMVVMGAVSI